jgi:exosortase E/protease (VPEID-CTERM system)
MDLRPAVDSPERRPLVALARRLGWFALLLIEVSMLARCSDLLDPAGLERWRARFYYGSWVVTRPSLVVAAATALLALAWRRWQPRHGGCRRLGDRTRAWSSALAHLVTFTGFAVLTRLLRDDEVSPSPAAGAGIALVAWAATGLSALGFWTAAAFADGSVGTPVWYGSMALAAGSATGVAAAAIGRAATGLWLPLSRSTLWVVHGLLSLVYADSLCLPANLIVGTPSFIVRIEPECSGYEGIGLILTFLAGYLWFVRRDYRFPRSLGLLPLGAGAMWLANAFRIALLIGLGTSVSPDVAERGFHSHAGWLALNSVGLGLVFATRRMRFFTSDSLAAERPRTSSPSVAYLAPLVAILATALVTGAFSSGFDWFYPARVLAAAAVLWAFRCDYFELRWTWSWPAVAIGAGTFLVWMALEPRTTSDAGATFSARLAALSPAGAIVWLAFRVVGSVVTVPLAEELAFRGYLTRRLISQDFESLPPGQFTWWSFLVSSVLFGALHGRWLAGTLAGMLYALALYRRGKLADAVLAHATTNALIAVYVLTTASWSLWT